MDTVYLGPSILFHTAPTLHWQRGRVTPCLPTCSGAGSGPGSLAGSPRSVLVSSHLLPPLGTWTASAPSLLLRLLSQQRPPAALLPPPGNSCTAGPRCLEAPRPPLIVAPAAMCRGRP
ncbi:hypothetical protein NDU88_004224 [Pleurodeles waltl]|uniref:Uncharacterized protein n=1 Tax=Pleurodeles waltl TaxID=8319 RepID=A0AAV7NM38_PLEWA|nr:hypothetical protein NDU88_004224 [Pleurodeles waltl]